MEQISIYNLKILILFYYLQAVEMTNNILKEFKSILNEIDWMDTQSKKAALDKVKSL